MLSIERQKPGSAMADTRLDEGNHLTVNKIALKVQALADELDPGEDDVIQSSL